MSPEYKFLVTADLETMDDARRLASTFNMVRGVGEVEIMLPLPPETANDPRIGSNKRVMTREDADRLLEDVDSLSLGELATALRVARGLRGVDVSNNGGPSAKTISQIERGQGGYGPSSVAKLAKGLGLEEADPMTSALKNKMEDQRVRPRSSVG